MASVNAHKVFFGAPEEKDFLSQISIEEDLEDGLRAARDKIRAHLREGLRAWQGHIAQDQLFEMAALKKSAEVPALRPKFRMQGSFVYRTVNDPAIQPPQEVDLDDGLFLPIGFFEKNGASPMVASKGFFELVESILLPLCKKEGWVLDTSKSSCVRIRLSQSAHIDIPLYAVADKAFAMLVETQAQKAVNVGDRAAVADGIELSDQIYKGLAQSEIRLAHRQDGWIDSDPRKIEEWFLAAIARHGEQVRRLSRYLKAWRDYCWFECKLSSLTLMQCVVMAFGELKHKVPQLRDDLALLEVVKKLPEYFQKDIENPVIEGRVLNDNWGDEMRRDYLEKAVLLRGRVNNALADNTPKYDVLKELRKAFGNRISDDESLVLHETTATVIRSYEPAKVPQPHVKRSTSG